MKRILTVTLTLTLLLVLAGCSPKEPTINLETDPNSEFYNWETTRKTLTKELVSVLKVITAGEADEYRTAGAAWAGRVSPDAHTVMFPPTTPPSDCSASVTYGGYSAPEFNSAGEEYIVFNVRRMNNKTLASVDWRIILKLSRGNTGYYISGYTMGNVK